MSDIDDLAVRVNLLFKSRTLGADSTWHNVVHLTWRGEGYDEGWDKPTRAEVAAAGQLLLELAEHLPDDAFGAVVDEWGNDVTPALVAARKYMNAERSAHDAEMAAARDADRVARAAEGGGL